MTSEGVDQPRLLGRFLRTRRERLQPGVVGLPGAPRRRRTPGLRREEVAQLCGISPTWYAWLEQGREVSASPHALARLAEALRLTEAERAYLFELAGRRDPAQAAAAGAAPPALAEAVARLDAPAYGLDRYWNACCWNPAAARLFRGWLDGPDRNLLRFTFLDPRARTLIRGWGERAARLAAEFRADFSHALADPPMRALVEELLARSPDFAACWDAQAVLGREGGLRRFDHPDDGPLAFEQFTFQPAERPDHKLVLLVPRPAANA